MGEKVKEKPKAQIQEQVREQYRPRKEGKSTFDKVLEQNKMLQKNTQQIQPKFGEAEQQESKVVRHHGQGEKGKDKQSDEKEQERIKEKAKDERKSGGEVDGKIVGKGRGKGSSDKGSGKGGQGQKGYGGSAQRKNIRFLKKGAFTKSAQAATESSKFQIAMKAQMKNTHLSKEFIQNLVNQIVKFVKSGINKDGEKEIRLDLHEKIFKGLRLRIALKDGKVTINLNSSNSKVRELFSSKSEDIQGQLEAKGIQVKEIKVT